MLVTYEINGDDSFPSEIIQCMVPVNFIFMKEDVPSKVLDLEKTCQLKLIIFGINLRSNKYLLRFFIVLTIA